MECGICGYTKSPFWSNGVSVVCSECRREFFSSEEMWEVAEKKEVQG